MDNKVHICEYCGKEHDGTYGSGRFCCKSCAVGWVSKNQSLETKRKKTLKTQGNFKRVREEVKLGLRDERSLGASRKGYWTEEAKSRHSEIMTEVMNRVEVREKLSESLTGVPISEERKLKQSHTMLEKSARGELKGFPKRNQTSFAEILWMRILDNNGVRYEREKVLVKSTDLGVKESGSYFLDFYIPEINLDFEVDGGLHDSPEAIEHNKLRDERIRSIGMNVLRIHFIPPTSIFKKRLIKKQVDEVFEYMRSLGLEVYNSFDDSSLYSDDSEEFDTED